MSAQIKPRKPSKTVKAPPKKSLWPAKYIPRVIVKFYPEIKIPDKESSFRKCLRDGKLGPWRQLLKDFDLPRLKMKRLISKVSPRKCRSLVSKAIKRNHSFRPPKLENYFVVHCPSRKHVQGMAKTLDAWNTTELAYIEGGPSPSPAISRATNLPYGPRQTYLGPAPEGIDAEYAWNKQGGDGAGVRLRFADVEQGWYLNHPDLPGNIEVIYGVNQELPHGTAVLGIVLAQDNGTGCVGITPNLRTTLVSSIWTDSPTDDPDRYHAILTAINRLDAGDVLLLELQVNAQGYYPTRLPGGKDGLNWYKNLPAEVESPLFDLIRMATDRGIIVVEAAGNGNVDLDAFDPYAAPHWGKDSGAIMVAAVDAPAVRASYPRFPDSNFGSRINCFAWGRQICVPYKLTRQEEYITDFGNTSGASAIIAGAALAVQGFAKANLNRTLSPDEMRDVLSDPGNGTVSTDPNATRIGVMPDLRKIIDNL